MRSALAIAGSDPTGGAGLQLDLQVFRCHGVHGAGVVTALTVQDTNKVHRVLPVFPSVVVDQLRALLRDWTPDAIQLGMLATDDVLRSVALGIEELDRDAGRRVPLVIDPVLRASDGASLLERRAWPALRGLFPRAALVTPNLPEAEALTERDVSTQQGVEQAARSLVETCGAEAVLVKGGHRDGPPDDLLARRGAEGIALDWLRGERLVGQGPAGAGPGGGRVHGTGCALAAAVTARLARGEQLEDAVLGARRFVATAIGRAEALGQGARLLGLSPA